MTAETLTVAFWNRRRQGNRQRQVKYLLDSQDRWDVLLLAEVSGVAFRDFRDQLALTGEHQAIQALDHRTSAPPTRYPHGVVAFSRPGLELRQPALIFEGNDREPLLPTERALAVELRGWGNGPITLLAWHAPYAAGSTTLEKQHNPIRKCRAYEAVTNWLASQDGPVIVGMDGNNWDEAELMPRTVPPDPTFGFEHDFHGLSPTHGLVDTSRKMATASSVQAISDEVRSLATTHAPQRGEHSRGHRMDRIYAGGLTMVDAGIDHGPLRPPSNDEQAPSSDHALVWATFAC